MKKNFNKYKFASRAVMIAFILLSTIQTLLDAEHVFNINLEASMFVASVIVSTIPIIILMLIMNMISRKFVVPGIKSIIKILFYLLVFGTFTIWSTSLVIIVGLQFESLYPMSAVPRFLISRIVFSIVYSSIVSMFFNGLSDLKIGKRKENGI